MIHTLRISIRWQLRPASIHGPDVLEVADAGNPEALQSGISDPEEAR